VLIDVIGSKPAKASTVSEARLAKGQQPLLSFEIAEFLSRSPYGWNFDHDGQDVEALWRSSMEWSDDDHLVLGTNGSKLGCNITSLSATPIVAHEGLISLYWDQSTILPMGLVLEITKVARPSLRCLVRIVEDFNFCLII
jgi:hypothetical protein